MKTPCPLETLARNVATLRDAHKWTQSELAKKAGVSQKVVSNMERAPQVRIYPSLETISAVATAFGIPAFALIAPLAIDDVVQLVDTKIARLVKTYAALPANSRSTIDRVAELESAAYHPR